MVIHSSTNNKKWKIIQSGEKRIKLLLLDFRRPLSFFFKLIKMKIFKSLIFASAFSVNAVSVNSNSVNYREKRFIADALQVIGTGVVNLGQGLEQNWAQVIESSMQDVVDQVVNPL